MEKIQNLIPYYFGLEYHRGLFRYAIFLALEAAVNMTCHVTGVAI